MFIKKRNLLILALNILSVSCQKNTQQTDVATTLEAHLWYPYQIEVIATDTITVQKYNPYPILVSTKTTIVNLDTIIISDNCLQNTILKFTSDSGVIITNPCNSLQSSLNASWYLSQNGSIQFTTINNPSEQYYLFEHFPFLFPFVNFPPSSTYSYFPISGNITSMNNSQFLLLTQNDIGKINKSTYTADTTQNYKIVEYTTYKSKN